MSFVFPRCGLVAVFVVLSAVSTHAFAPLSPNTMSSSSSLVRLSATRREWLAAAAAATVTTSSAAPAHASYSAYTRREQDWQDRSQAGAISYSTARDLRNQLQEMVPQNNANSKIFCPNGPSAAVSPLMENKCGDRLATPSVFGRSDDVLGNSIPGFGYSAGVGVSSNVAADIGGFPAYNKMNNSYGPK